MSGTGTGTGTTNFEYLEALLYREEVEAAEEMGSAELASFVVPDGLPEGDVPAVTNVAADDTGADTLPWYTGDQNVDSFGVQNTAPSTDSGGASGPTDLWTAYQNFQNAMAPPEGSPVDTSQMVASNDVINDQTQSGIDRIINNQFSLQDLTYPLNEPEVYGPPPNVLTDGAQTTTIYSVPPQPPTSSPTPTPPTVQSASATSSPDSGPTVSDFQEPSDPNLLTTDPFAKPDMNWMSGPPPTPAPDTSAVAESAVPAWVPYASFFGGAVVGAIAAAIAGPTLAGAEATTGGSNLTGLGSAVGSSLSGLANSASLAYSAMATSADAALASLTRFIDTAAKAAIPRFVPYAATGIGGFLLTDPDLPQQATAVASNLQSLGSGLTNSLSPVTTVEDLLKEGWHFHHWFPKAKALAERFADLGIDVHEYTTLLPPEFHIQDLHVEAEWNKIWEAWLDMAEDEGLTMYDAVDHLFELLQPYLRQMEEAGVLGPNGLDAIVPYPGKR